MRLRRGDEVFVSNVGTSSNKVKSSMVKIRVALIGTPNVGKSVIFNKLTGGKAWVGNWPGVTVEKKVGKLIIGKYVIEVTDLPGIYGLTAYTVDEVIARNFILEETPDVVVVIANAANLERSLHLVLSILELGVKLVVALNMIDVARDEGIEIDWKKLSKLLGVPVIPTIAITGYGINELINAIITTYEEGNVGEYRIDYGPQINYWISKLCKELSSCTQLKYPIRWVAIKLLEGDKYISELIRKLCPKVIKVVNNARKELESIVGDVETFITEARYRESLRIAEVVRKYLEVGKVTITEIIDSVLTHKVLGIPLALTIMYLLFRFAFEVSTPLVDLVSLFFDEWLRGYVLSLHGLPDWLISLLADGVLSGVGAVLTFLPVIFLFFLGLSLLEDVGYLARFAFVVDKIFHKFGLPGKVAIPLIIGFGCNVPAVMATRTIEDENDRKVSVLIAPLSSCSARLPVYLAIAGAVMGSYAGAAVASMYWIGILLALIVGLIMRKLLFKGPSTGFIMELPPYLMPRPADVLSKTWERTKKFLVKAGTVILGGVIVVWLLSVTGPSGYLGPQALTNTALLERSWIGFLGHVISYFMAPMGWDWRACSALLFGLVAKEIVLGSLGVLYGVSKEGLSTTLSHVFTPLTGFAYMLFILLYMPCIGTLAAIRSELGTKYALLALVYQVVLAYIVSLSVVTFGKLLGLG